MVSIKQKEFHDVVVGPGALGTALAAVLARCGPVGLLGRSPPSGPVFVENEQGIRTPVSLPLSRTPQAVLLQLPPRNLRKSLAVWVTLPPETAERVGGDALSAFVRGGEKSIVAVFGNNGILSPKRFEAFLSVVPPDVEVTFLRAIFFTGFLRDWHAEGGATRVRHTGGQRVVLGPLVPARSLSAANRARERAIALIGRLGAGLDPGNGPGNSPYNSPFAFEWRDDVRRVEIVKFYVNAMLAFGTGPYALTNGTLHDRVSPPWLVRWAEVFSFLFPLEEGIIPTDEFLATLERTIDSTPSNVNSVSLAGSRGDVETLRAFVDTLQRNGEPSSHRSGPSGLAEDVEDFLITERERVEREWGLRTQCNP